MIVRTTSHGIQLITQPDHAHLARRIMEHCVPLRGCARRPAILRAIGEHDNGWDEVDASPLVDPATGRVADFVSVPLAVRHAVWPRAVSRLADDPWVGALVAHHALTVYDRFRRSEEWSRFFAQMQEARDTMLRASTLSLDALTADYPYLRLGDLISLAFCTDSGQEMRFAEWTVRLSDGRVLVSPDPFGGATISFEVQARQIAAQVFRSDADLRDALRTADPILLGGEVAGG
jgi:hypothetical protein